MNPLQLAIGPESLLADRLVVAILSNLRESHPNLSSEIYDAAQLEVSALAELLAPSLFSEPRLIVLKDLQDLPEELQALLKEYALEPDPNITLVMTHKGGVKGKSLLDSLRKAGAKETPCEAIKRDGDKIQFVRTEALSLNRKISADAAKALVDAVGSDLRELANALSQLISDTAGEITVEAVERFHGGRVEATGFDVTDAVIEGRDADALRVLRQAIDTGTDPVMIVSALAAALRTLARVGSAPRSLRSAELAGELGLAPWQVDKARRQLPGWSGPRIATAISEVAKADGSVKGGAVLD